jgi:hypothetical protein
MTVYEALALGVPVVVCDRAIADELGGDAAPWVWCAEGPEPSSLAQVLGSAARAVRSQDGPRVPRSFSTGLLQSAQSGRLLAVYAEALGRSAHQITPV